MTEDLTLDEVRTRIAADIAANAAFDGWGDAARDLAAEMAGIDRDIAALAFRQTDDGGLGNHAVRANGDAAALGANARVRVDYCVLCDLDGVGTDDGGFVGDDGGGVNGAWWALYREGVGCCC